MRKLLLTRRWIGLTALAVVLITAMLALGWWQLQRGEAGNARSWGYTFQWPAFAIFVGYMWVRMLREDLHPADDAENREALLARRSAATDGLDPLPAGRPDIGVAADVRDEDGDPGADPEVDAELEEYNRYLADLNAARVRARR